MAKRKRLTPANPVFLDTDSAATAPAAPPPIAGVAGDASAHSALQEVTETLSRAKEEGRLVISVPLAQIDQAYLVRDRVSSDTEEFEALVASIRARGQQTPIEVAPLSDGRYGLISGWRRCQALAQIHGETGEVQALIRRSTAAADTYVAMVEENEIRVGLSYFERARVALKTVDQGVFPSAKEALLSLFSTASRAKRSKIRSFLTIVRNLDGTLLYPQNIGERLGLKLAKALEEDPSFEAALQERLQAVQDMDPDTELAVLTTALDAREKGAKTVSNKSISAKEETLEGLKVRSYENGARVDISGPAMTPALYEGLMAWLREHTG